MRINKKQLYSLFEVQSKLNAATCGEDWLKGICKTGKPIAYDTAILVEAAEFIDSFDWKHWKYSGDDFENAKVELIDLLHFVISLIIYVMKIRDFKHETLTGLFDDIVVTFKYNGETKNDEYVIEGKEFDIFKVRVLLNNFIFHILALNNAVIQHSQAEAARNSMSVLMVMMSYLNMEWNEIYELYISKNALNYLRLNNGYQDGTYVKQWGEVEDNVVMNEIKEHLLLHDELTFDNMYNALHDTYHDMVV